MKKIAIFILLFLVSITTLNIKAQNETQPEQLSFMVEYIMGTTIYVQVNVGENATKAEKDIIRADIENIFYKYNYLSKIEYNILTLTQQKVYSKGKDLVDIKVSLEDINKAPNEKIEISQELYEMLELAEEIRLETDGYFDYSIGKIINVWKDAISKYSFREIPQQQFEEIFDTVNQIEIAANPITLSEEDGKYYIVMDELALLDLGALAKGYVTQKVVEYLKEKNITTYIINSGASSIAAGQRIDGSAYEIELLNPTNVGDATYAVATFKNESLTSSGDNIQHFLYNGERFHHIISPKTKTPITNYHVLSIVGEDAGITDAYSTALFSMSQKDAKSFLKKVGISGIFYNTDQTVDIVGESFKLLTTPREVNLGRYIILGVYIIIALTAIAGAVVYFVKQNKKIEKPANFKLRRDFILFGVLALVFGGAFLNYYFWPRPAAVYAEITYQNEVYVEIDFEKQKVIPIKYQDEGYPTIDEKEDVTVVVILGDYKENSIRQEVVIEINFKERKIRVSDEKSPNNYCSKQSWATNGYIICLPNSVTIKFKSSLNSAGGL